MMRLGLIIAGFLWASQAQAALSCSSPHGPRQVINVGQTQLAISLHSGTGRVLLASATCPPAPPPLPPAQYVTGPLGSGLVMTGQTDLLMPTSTSLQACCSLTVSVLVKTTTLSGATSKTIFASRLFPFSGFFFDYLVGDGLLFTIMPSGGSSGSVCGLRQACFSPASVNDGNLHLITASYADSSGGSNVGGPITLYIDAIPVASATATAGIAGTQSAYNILRGFVGTAIDLRYYAHRALSGADVSALWALYQSNLTAGNLNPLNAGLTVWAPMDSANIVGNTVLDLSGNNNTAFFDATTPTVAVTAPTNGATVSGTITLTATATDVGGAGINYVQFSIDGNAVGPQIKAAPYTTTWDSTLGVDASRAITATAVGNNGASAMNTINVTTNNGITPNTYEIATAGSNSNPCTVAQPCQTIAKANSLVYRGGDTLLLHGTDSFVGCLAINTTNLPFGSPSTPLTIGSDGAGTATITSNCTGETGVISQTGVYGVTWHDLNIRNGSTTGTQPRGGFWCANTALLGVGGIILENLDIAGFSYATTTSGAEFGAYVMCSAFAGGPGLDGLQIINSTLHGLSGNTSSDDIGTFFFAGPLAANMKIQGTSVFNVGGTVNLAFTGIGIEPSDSNGSETVFSLVHDIGANTKTCGGPAGYETTQARNPYVHFSEVYNVAIVGAFPSSACDNDGYDFDVGTSGGLGEDLYSHNESGIDYLLFNGTAGGIASSGNGFRNSIAENSYILPGLGGMMQVTGGSSPNGNFFIQMSAYTNKAGTTTAGNVSVAEGLGVLFGPPFVYANNIAMLGPIASGSVKFVNNNGGSGGCSGPLYTSALFQNNDWFQIAGGTPNWTLGFTPCTSLAAWQATATGRDAGATTGNPGVTSAGGGGTLTWTPSTQATWPPATDQPTAYQLTGGSAIRSSGGDLSPLVGGSGSVLPSLPTRDYYGLVYPGTGNCVSIGANNACP